MTNEELVQRIQGGETTLMADLWAQTAQFFKGKAYGFFIKNRDRCASSGVEIDDIVQCGYLALREAVKAFDAGAGLKLLSYTAFPLKNQFKTLVGLRTSKRDPLNESASLNETVGDDEGDTTRLDLLEDPNASAAFDDTESDIYNGELRAALDVALDNIPVRRADVIRGRYLDGKGQKAIAAEIGVSKAQVSNIEREALNELRRQRALQAFHDEIIEQYAFTGTGFKWFKEHMMSSVEHALIRADELSKRFDFGGDGVDEHND